MKNESTVIFEDERAEECWLKFKKNCEGGVLEMVLLLEKLAWCVQKEMEKGKKFSKVINAISGEFGFKNEETFKFHWGTSILVRSGWIHSKKLHDWIFGAIAEKGLKKMVKVA